MSSSDPDLRISRDLRSRVIHLDAGQRRDRSANFSTVIAVVDHAYAPAVPFEALFVAHYRAIRALGREAAGQGVAIVAVHVPSCTLAARAWVAARPGKVASAIIGRHSQADVLLDAPALSLRHLAVLIAPQSSWVGSDVRFEILDLRTQETFRDERGRPLEGIAAEGPALISCGPFALFFLPTGDPSDWPELATDAWAMLPERIFVGERAAEPDRWRRRGYAARGVGKKDRAQSCITLVPAPLAPGELLVADGESPIGTLWITGPRGEKRLAVGRIAAERGILLGRYTRCDASDVLADEYISRAHLLVKEVGGELVGIDTASTEGTFVEGREHAARTIALGRGEVAKLAGKRAFVRWVPVGS